MVEWIEEKMKHSWMVGWTGKIEGWRDGYKKCMDRKKNGWMDKTNRWMDG